MGCTCLAHGSQGPCLPPGQQHLLSRVRSKGCGYKWSDLSHPGSGMLVIALGTSVGQSPCPWPPIRVLGGVWVSGSLPLDAGRSGWPRFLQDGPQKDAHPPFSYIPFSASPAASEGLINTGAMGPACAPSPRQGKDCRDAQSEGTGSCLQARGPIGGCLCSSLRLSTPWHSPPLLYLVPCSVLTS